jgi:hypothetical protein
MSDLVHDYRFALHVEAHAVIARAQPMPAGQVAGKGLRAADVWPAS